MMPVVIATITFLILDALWLGIIATQLYINEFGQLMRMSNGAIQPLWPAAFVVYFALILGIVLFVIPKAQGSWTAALLWGGLYGFITYATYDFTNLSTLSAWTWKISIIDTLWGMVLCGLTSAITVFFTK